MCPRTACRRPRSPVGEKPGTASSWGVAQSMSRSPRPFTRTLSCVGPCADPSVSVGVNMANSGCSSLSSGWNMIDAAPAYATFAGVLGGFLFLGIITLLSVRGDPDKLEGGARTQPDTQRLDR